MLPTCGTAGAIQPPALICGMPDVNDFSYWRRNKVEVAEALCGALQSLGWSALEGWDGWGLEQDNVSEAACRNSWRVWIVPAVRGLPPGGGPAAADSVLSAESEGRRADFIEIKAFCTVDALADACLRVDSDPAGPASGPSLGVLGAVSSVPTSPGGCCHRSCGEGVLAAQNTTTAPRWRIAF